MPNLFSENDITIKPTIFYHGTTHAFSSFSLDNVGAGIDQYGSGIYFTSCSEDAGNYTVPRESQPHEGGGNIVPVIIKMKSPIIINRSGDSALENISAPAMRKNKIKRIILAAPNVEKGLENWGEVGYEKLSIIIDRAADAYVGADNLLDQINLLSNDFYAGNESVLLGRLYEITGYDGVMIQMAENITHVVVWDPSQISSIFDPAVSNILRNEPALKVDSIFTKTEDNSGTQIIKI
jgi:hypothetical protein